MPKEISSLDQLIEAREEAREVLRELHGVLKDCKRAKAEIVQLLNRGTAVLVLSCLNEELDHTVEKVSIHLGHTIDEAVIKVMTRFNQLSSLLDEREETVQETLRIVSGTTEQVQRFLDNERRTRDWTRRNDPGTT